MGGIIKVHIPAEWQFLYHLSNIFSHFLVSYPFIWSEEQTVSSAPQYLAGFLFLGPECVKLFDFLVNIARRTHPHPSQTPTRWPYRTETQYIRFETVESGGVRWLQIWQLPTQQSHNARIMPTIIPYAYRCHYGKPISGLYIDSRLSCFIRL